MPYMKKGKCVYKKNKDGSQGKKVGCTEGPVDDYLKALYANVDDAPKKENKTMKIKKSALLALIKEEIMAEAEMFKMSDDDLRDFSVPDPPEYQASDEAFNKVNELIKDFQEIAVMMQDENNYEDELLEIIREIITSSPELDTQAVAMQAFPLLIQKLKADSNQYHMMQEGIENITRENIEIVGQAMAQMAPLIGTMSLPILIGMIYEKLKEMGAK